MPEDKKQYLKFTETNPWEGETWTVYTPLDDPSDLSLAKELTSYDYPGQYEFEIVNAHPDQLRQLEAFSDSYDDADLDEGSGYYPSYPVHTNDIADQVKAPGACRFHGKHETGLGQARR